MAIFTKGARKGCDVAKETVLDRLKFAAGGRVPDADLILLADVVRQVGNVAKVPLKAAAADVLDALGKDAAGLFGLRPGDWPIELSEGGPNACISQALQRQQGRRVLSRGIDSQGALLSSGYQSPSVEPLPPGRAGWLALLRTLWVDATPLERGDGHLDFGVGGHVAITRKDAARLFGVGAASLAMVAIQPSAADAGDGTDNTIVQPDGAAWPHAKGAKWTDAERVAMRAMRTDGMTDAAIGAAAGCKRQIVGAQIGSTQANKAAAARGNSLSALG